MTIEQFYQATGGSYEEAFAWIPFPQELLNLPSLFYEDTAYQKLVGSIVFVAFYFSMNYWRNR